MYTYVHYTKLLSFTRKKITKRAGSSRARTVVEDDTARRKRDAPMQSWNSDRTTWHLTFGTYGARLHGSVRPTVDKQHNRLGTSFLPTDAMRQRRARNRMRFTARLFTPPQRLFIEQQIGSICERGGWDYRISVSAAEADHIHLLCDIVPEVHGEKVRRLVKRWLGQALSERWPLANGERWWAERGSRASFG